MTRPKRDLVGQRFGRWTVIQRSTHKHNEPRTHWICQCECGNIGDIREPNLLRGISTSCGCSRNGIENPNYRHGLCETRIYRIYNHMVERCHKEYCKYYYNYGARGISVCDEWRHSFQEFYEWSMQNGYQEDLTIDRIDSNGNYEPDNCRWATVEVQNNNKRNNVHIEINGVSKTAVGWEKHSGIKASTIRRRVKMGWTGESIIGPLRK